MRNGSCFLCEVVTPNTLVHLGNKTMAVKDLRSEMESGSLFGKKLKAIAEKVEALG